MVSPVKTSDQLPFAEMPNMANAEHKHPTRPFDFSNWTTTCAANTRTAKEVWSCGRDEGRPLGAGDQAQASNHCELLALRAVVVSVAGKGGTRSRQVGSGETSASEPLMTCRNSQDDVETGDGSGPRDEFGRSPEGRPGRHPAWRRRESGSGSFVERGNLSPRCQGRSSSGRPPQEPEYRCGAQGRSSP